MFTTTGRKHIVLKHSVVRAPQPSQPLRALLRGNTEHRLCIMIMRNSGHYQQKSNVVLRTGDDSLLRNRFTGLVVFFLTGQLRTRSHMVEFFMYVWSCYMYMINLWFWKLWVLFIPFDQLCQDRVGRWIPRQVDVAPLIIPQLLLRIDSTSSGSSRFVHLSGSFRPKLALHYANSIGISWKTGEINHLCHLSLPTTAPPGRLILTRLYSLGWSSCNGFENWSASCCSWGTSCSQCSHNAHPSLSL